MSRRYQTTGHDQWASPRSATAWQRERTGVILPMEEPRSLGRLGVAIVVGLLFAGILAVAVMS